MGRARYAVLTLAVSLLMAGVSGGQERALGRVKSESAWLRQSPSASEEDVWKEIKVVRDRSAGLHSAVRDWIESLLPQSRAALDSEFSFLNPRLNAELQRAGLIRSVITEDDFRPGFVTRMELSRPPEDPDKLAVTVGIGVPCGSDDLVYVYDYSQGPPRRVLESRGTRDHDESISSVRFSKRDASGSQLILTLRYAVQCGSFWNRLSYDLFRLSSAANMALRTLGGEQGVYFGAYDPYQLRLEPDELLMEIRDHSIDSGVRPHVLHYNVANSAGERIDPVALQPQDFVDEWLMRPWSEMESRSAESVRDKLKKWHEFLAGDFVAGKFNFVQACREKPDQWQVGVALDWIKGKELPEPLSAYFLVQQSEQYRFKMVGISFDRQDGCPGETRPNTESPSMFPRREHR